jgi:hypothetical protein
VTTTIYLDKKGYVEVAKIAKTVAAKLKTVNGGGMLLFPQPISKSMIAESRARGSSPVTLQNREQLCKHPHEQSIPGH